MLLAGKVLAATAIRLFSDSALLAASQQELRQVLAERPYRCPIPAEVRPFYDNHLRQATPGQR
jgi:aminobenzoyl-glutamate utilization protein B